jgi:hypothetical protein
MKSKFLTLVMGMALAASGQRGGRGIANPEEGVTPPQGMSDIARAKTDHEQNVKDAARLAELAAKVRDELAQSRSYSLSAGTVKDLDEMEKLTKKLRSRIKSASARPVILPMEDVTTTGGGRR